MRVWEEESIEQWLENASKPNIILPLAVFICLVEGASSSKGGTGSPALFMERDNTIYGTMMETVIGVLNLNPKSVLEGLQTQRAAVPFQEGFVG